MTRECANGAYINNVTAITEVFTDGQEVTALAIEYDQTIDNSKLLKSSFSVNGRIITQVYANSAAAKAAQGQDGRYVIVELSPDDQGASTIVASKENKSRLSRKEVRIGVVQSGDITTTAGDTYPASSDVMVNNSEINLVADDFLEQEFRDLKTGESLKYSLFIPVDYNPNRSYPLVVFVHDKGVCSKDNLGLIQGLGGIIWATSAEQEKRACFVLVPQYPEAIVNDNFETTVHLDITIDLITHIVNEYNIDRSRLYATGQSMGCMALMEMGIRYPHIFAAALLCAGQWNPETISALANNKMWILVSEGDDKAFNGMNLCMGKLEAAGARISRAKWDGHASEDETASSVRKMIAEGKNIKYTVYRKGTVVPVEEQGDSSIPEMLKNHMHTWRIVYNTEALRDWLFTQRKNS